MTRRHLTFACEGATLAASLDEAPGSTGLLIVTGGNETRAGAFSGQAQLAARIAAAGYPVFRFDRRGTGDSEGANAGFRGSAADIAAALQAFRDHVHHLRGVAGFGNCDAASALMLGKGRGFDALILSNPWTIEQEDPALPPETVRARYAKKLRNPKELARLLKGDVNLGKLARGLAGALRPAPPPSSLAKNIAQGLAEFSGPTVILLAERDRTAQTFIAGWRRDDSRLRHCPDANHAFAEPHAREWLFNQIIAMLEDGLG